jgi:ABC-type polar amino acid transport system ATPase subunit
LRREIGIVFQSYNLFPYLCVERNITLGPTAAKGIKPAAARELCPQGHYRTSARDQRRCRSRL